MEARIRQDHILEIHLPDMAQRRLINLDAPIISEGARDYLVSSLHVIARHGIKVLSGYTVTIHGAIPINAGLSSSSAVVVAWIRFLLKAFGNEEQQSATFVARLAYEAEVLQYNSPGGLMDQYTISLGDLVFLDTVNGAHRYISQNVQTLIIGESGVPKQTLGVLGNLRSKAQKAIQQVRRKHNSFDLKAADIQDYQELKDSVNDELRPYFYAALKNYNITKKAMQALDNEVVNLSDLGSLMYEHHTVLRDILKITVPIIDSMIEAAMEHGAYGAKIVGSGGGGCMVALTSPSNEERITEAIKKAGASSSYAIKISSGAAAYTSIS